MKIAIEQAYNQGWANRAGYWLFADEHLTNAIRSGSVKLLDAGKFNMVVSYSSGSFNRIVPGDTMIYVVASPDVVAAPYLKRIKELEAKKHE